MSRRDALENERQAIAGIEPATRAHHSHVRLRAVSAGHLVGVRSQIGMRRHRKFACGARTYGRGQHKPLSGHPHCVSAPTARNDFVGEAALKFELLPPIDSHFFRRHSQWMHRPSEPCAGLIGFSPHLFTPVGDYILMKSDRPNDNLRGLRETAHQSEHSYGCASHRTLPKLSDHSSAPESGRRSVRCCAPELIERERPNVRGGHKALVGIR